MTRVASGSNRPALKLVIPNRTPSHFVIPNRVSFTLISNRFFFPLCHSEPHSGEESAFLGVRSDSAGGQD